MTERSGTSIALARWLITVFAVIIMLVVTGTASANTYTVSGTVADQNGNPFGRTDLPNGYGNQNTWFTCFWTDVAGDPNQGCGPIDTNTGRYSYSVPADTYDQVQVEIPGYIFRNQAPTPFDLTVGDRVQDFHITMVPVTVTVENSNGRTLDGVPVTGKPGPYTNGMAPVTPPFVDGSSVNGYINVEGPVYSGTTDSNGRYTFIVPAGITLPASDGGPYSSPYGLCGTVSGNLVCGNADVIVHEATSIVLRQAPVAAPPSNLTAPAAARAPTLSWPTSSGADWYDIYRDGINIGSAPGTATTFTDTYAQDGTHTYYVTAVNSGGQSAPSPSASVVVDTTPPTASSVSLSPKRIKTRGTLTVTAKATDARSGVANGEFFVDNDPGVGSATTMTYGGGTVTGSATISGLSRGTHNVYVRVRDNAGNWSALTSAAFRYNP
jgi:hypothetical protein